MAEQLTGKVATIINQRELAINIGAQSGVTPGMRFAVMSATPAQVKDPDTQEVIGEIDRVKVRVQAVEVHPKIAVCRTYEKRIIGGSALFDILSGSTTFGLPPGSTTFGQPRREVPVTLSIKDADVVPPLSEGESYVLVGDRVVQIASKQPSTEST